MLRLAGHSTGAICWTEYQTALTGKSYYVQTQNESEKTSIVLHPAPTKCTTRLHSLSLLLLCISLFVLFYHRFICVRCTSK